MELEKVKIRLVIGPTPSGAAVLLGNDTKTFVVFVGFYEAAALIREINDETPARPLTYELIQSVFLGFDVEVKQVIISSIIDNTFCATLILQQKLVDGDGEWNDKRNEVRIDARPSDCLVLALKNKVDIYVTREVFDQVQDVSNMDTGDLEGGSFTLDSLEIGFEAGVEGVTPTFEATGHESAGEVDLGEELEFPEIDTDDPASESGEGGTIDHPKD